MMVKNPIKYVALLEKVYSGEEIKCPECGRAGLDHRFFSDDDHVGFAQFHCQHCGADAHLCRVKFPENVETVY